MSNFSLCDRIKGMKRLLTLSLLLILLASCSTSSIDYSAQEYKVSGEENLDQIIKSKFPAHFTDDAEERENLLIMLKTFNSHLPNFPNLKDGDVIYLSRPVSPFIPSL